jgi:hypothetical protein
MATPCEYRTVELLDRLQNGTHRRRGRPANKWKHGFRDSMKRRNFKDVEYFNQELWRKKRYALGAEENCVFAEKYL